MDGMGEMVGRLGLIRLNRITNNDGILQEGAAVLSEIKKFIRGSSFLSKTSCAKPRS